MWFVAIDPGYGRGWLVPLLGKLLAADPATLRLLRSAPFGSAAPAAVRAVQYRYRFTTRAERREAGAWWHREPLGVLAGPVTEQPAAGRR
jgi:hypothetical protein